MPTKSTKVQGAGVYVYADGGILKRVQSFSSDSDLGLEEIRELSNDNIVEFVEGIPTVSVQVEANMFGDRSNLARLSGGDGLQQKVQEAGNVGLIYTSTNSINHKTYDGTSVDFVVQVEEDGVLKRSMHIGDAFITSVGLSFDVGGVATESYSLEADNKVWYLNAQKEIMISSGYYNAAVLTSGVFVTPHPSAGDYFLASGFSEDSFTAHAWTPLYVFIDGTKVVNTSTGNAVAIQGGEVSSDEYILNPNLQYEKDQFSSGRIRILGYKTIPSTAGITAPGTLAGAGAIGGIRKGMIELFLVSGWMHDAVNRTADDITMHELLRLQTCSIDVDLAREALEELGNYQAFDRSLNFPITATVNFSALASDLQNWASFSNQGLGWDDSGLVETQFRDFVQDAGLLIKIYNDDAANVNRAHLMTVIVSGVRVASESFSVDAGGNATQEFSCTADNFLVS